MPSINDLRNNNANNDNDVVIDATSSSGIARAINEANKKVVINPGPGRKTIVNQRPQTVDRVEADLSNLPDPERDEANSHIHESIEDDLLSGKNPILYDYIANKKAEMEEWVAEKEDEAALAAEEAELAENTLSDGEEIYTDSTYNDMDDELNDTDDVLNDSIITVESVDIDNTPASSNVNTIELDELGTATTTIDSSDEEIEDDDTTELDQNIANDEDESIKKLQQLATEKIKPISNRLNLSTFTITKKPTINTRALTEKPVNVAKWVLPNQKSIVLMKEFLGSELEELRTYSANSSSISSLTNEFRVVYEHIASPKPSTFDAWIKSTPYSDLDHYFFAIYIANFKGANYIPGDCTNDKCKETFLSDDVNIMDMVKFKDDTTKAEFNKIYQDEEVVSNSKGLYVTEIIPLSNKVAIGFREPSINNFLEIATLDAAFRQKYASIINYIPFIDSLYIIHEDTQTLEPIGYKGYADNAIKTVKSKIQKFDSVLKTLTADEFNILEPYIAAINNRESGYSYVFPALTCPKCGTEIPEQPITAQEMVFTRCQLGKLVTTSLN